MISVPTLERQPCLFEALPSSEPRRRPGRRPPKTRAAALPPAAETTAETTAESTAEPTPPPPMPGPALRGFAESPPRLDPGTLTHPDLSDLVGALPESSLAYLLVQTVREARRRLEPTAPEDDESPADYSPSPLLVRALKTVLLDLTESE